MRSTIVDETVPKKSSEEGFTLVELLIAIFIFAIVMSAVYGSYRATFKVVDDTEKQIRIMHQAAITFERLREDLQSIVMLEDAEIEGEKRDQAGHAGFSLSFISSKHLQLRLDDPQYGWSKITYYTKLNDETGLLDLYREDVLWNTEDEGNDSSEEEKGDLLLTELNNAQLNYVHEDSENSEEWNNKSASQNADLFPKLIYIDLEIASSETGETTWRYRSAVALQSNSSKTQ